MDIKHAIDSGDVALVRRMLEGNSHLASQMIRWGPLFRKCSTEPLHYLSDAPFNRLFNHGRQAELARELLEAGAPVDGLPASGETPLHGAASLGEPGVAAVLIDYGANMEAVARYPGVPDGTPLDFAVHFGMVEVVDLLVARGAHVLSARMAAGVGQLSKLQKEFTIGDVEERLDVFRCAAVCDRTEVVAYLIDHGIDVNAEIDGATALHWAAWESKPGMVDFLLAKGADRTRQDRNHQMTPAGWAEHRGKELGPRWGHADIIRLLDST
jgi:uncharacterized protein